MNMKLWILLLSLCVGLLAESAPFNPCISSPCQNGGRCVISKYQGSYYCACDTRYTGRFCEIGKVITCNKIINKIFPSVHIRALISVLVTNKVLNETLRFSKNCSWPASLRMKCYFVMFLLKRKIKNIVTLGWFHFERRNYLIFGAC